MLAQQRHVGIYRCDICGLTHRIVGDRVRPEDVSLPVDGPPPMRGMAFALHRLLRGPTAPSTPDQAH